MVSSGLFLLLWERLVHRLDDEDLYEGQKLDDISTRVKARFLCQILVTCIEQNDKTGFQKLVLTSKDRIPNEIAAVQFKTYPEWLKLFYRLQKCSPMI